MSLWARGAWTFVIGAALFVICGVATLYGGHWLIPILGRQESWIGIVVGTIVSIGLMVLGLAALVRGLIERDRPTSS